MKENDILSEEIQCTVEQFKGLSFRQYFVNELTRGFAPERGEAKYTKKREQVYTFIKIPKELETFIWFGFLQCLDTFLFIFTFLPLRFLLTVVKMLTHPCASLFKRRRPCLPELQPAEKCDLLKVCLMLSCCYAMSWLDISVVYHLVRAQSLIKLYIFFNMLECVDRLFSPLGQDVLDALFWTATEPQNRKRDHLGVMTHFVMAAIYVALHAGVVLLQATTLNVAFNSHSKALLTIMMSNNFVEVKGSVFKSFNQNTLFQLSCWDVRERFHYLVMFLIIILRNLRELSWDLDHLNQLVPDMLVVLLVEFCIDWVKHCFITRFNNLQASMYRSYLYSIAYDTVSFREENAFSDRSDQISRRMQFTPLPLAVLLSLVLVQTVPMTQILAVAGYTLVLYVCLLLVAVVNGHYIVRRSCRLVEEHQRHLATQRSNSAPSASTTPSPSPSRAKDDLCLVAKLRGPGAESQGTLKRIRSVPSFHAAFDAIPEERESKSADTSGCDSSKTEAPEVTECGASSNAVDAAELDRLQHGDSSERPETSNSSPNVDSGVARRKPQEDAVTHLRQLSMTAKELWSTSSASLDTPQLNDHVKVE